MTWQKWLPFSKATAIQSSENDPAVISWCTDIDNWDRQTPCVVEAGQLAMIIRKQTIVAILEQGSYPLDWVLDDTTPTSLKIVYFSTKTFSDLRWGTPSPIIVNDTRIGMNALRAHGIFAVKLNNPKRLWQHIPNDAARFTTDDVSLPLRALILDEFTAKVSQNQNNILQFLSERQTFSQAIKETLIPHFENFGLQLVDFIVQSVSAPDNQTNSMSAVAKLEKLSDMLKQGIITQEEFDDKKQQLLKDI